MAKVKTNFKTRRRTYIREWRKHRTLTLEQLSERADLTPGTLSLLERGKINYSQPTLEALATALQCEPADLLMRDPSQTQTPWSLWDQALPGDKQKIIEMMKVITGKTGTKEF